MPTTKYAIPYIDGNHDLEDGPADINAVLDSIDGKMTGYSAAVIASRPTSTSGSPGVAGRIFRATDTGQRFQDHGTGWEEIAWPRKGATIRRNATQSISNNSLTAVTWDTIDEDENGGYGSDLVPTVANGIVLPRTGIYHLTAACTWSALGGAGARRLQIESVGVGGAFLDPQDHLPSVPASTAIFQGCSVLYPCLDVGDTITARVLQTSGAALTITLARLRAELIRPL